MSYILAKLFGSSDRLKIVRLFLLNPEKIFVNKDIAKRAKITSESTRKQTGLLSAIGLIVRKKKTIEVQKRRKKVDGWMLDISFPLLIPLKGLVLDTTPVSRGELLKKLNRAGRIKLVILAGIFTQAEDSRVDILIVGDKIKKNILNKAFKEIEAEIGKELVYAVLETENFVYRLNIYDKFLRDILDYPHQKILDKIGISG